MAPQPLKPRKPPGATPKRPKKPAKGNTTAQKKKLDSRFVDKAKKGNPPGVRIIGEKNEDNTALMAGYLNFPTITAFREYLAGETVASILDELKAEKDKGYDCVNLSNEGIKTKNFHKIVANLSPAEVTAIEDAYKLPSADDLGLLPSNNRIVYLKWIACANRLLSVGDEEQFPHPIAYGECVQGFYQENWHRALYVLKHHIRQSQDGRAASGARKGRDTITIPQFLTEKDLEKFVNEDSDEEVGILNAFYKTQKQIEELLGDVSAVENVMTVEELEEAADSNKDLEAVLTTKLMSRANSSIGRDVRSQRVLLTKSQAIGICKDLGNKVTELWGKEQIDNMRMEAAKASNAVDMIKMAEFVQKEMQVARAMQEEEDAEDDPTGTPEMSDKYMKKAYSRKVEDDIGSTSAPLPPHEVGCRYVGVTPEDLSVPGTDPKDELKFKEYQPSAAYFMRQRELVEPKCSILGLKNGLGKTVTSLAHILAASREDEKWNAEHPNEEQRVYRATLVLMPAPTIEVWRRDGAKFFPGQFTEYQLYGNPRSVGPEYLSSLLEQAEDLKSMLKALDPTKPQTGRTIVYSSYVTYFQRILGFIEAEQTKRCFAPGQKVKKNAEKQTGRVYVCLVQYAWERVICDESQIIKNPASLVHEAVLQTRKKAIHFISATMIHNHSRDMRGPLHLIWNPEWQLHNGGNAMHEAYQSGFDPLKVDFKTGGSDSLQSVAPRKDHEDYAAFMDMHNRGLRLWILDPNAYRRIGEDKGWSTYITDHILRPILEMLALRLGMATKIDLGNGKTMTPGDSVPPCHIYTVQLKMNAKQQLEYNTKTLHLLKNLYTLDGGPCGSTPLAKTTGNSNSRGKGLINASVHRYLMHATLDPALAKLTVINHKKMAKFDDMGVAKTPVSQYTDLDSDCGASFYYMMTRPSQQFVVPSDRMSLASYLTYYSVKMQWALGKLGEWVLTEGKKCILIFQYPMSQWDMEMNLINLGFRVVSMKAQHTQTERQRMIDDFNNPKSGVQIMLLGMRLGSVSINLQFGAHRMIIMEWFESVQAFLQALGRIYRLGQKHEQWVFVPWIDHSYDQLQMHRISRKFVSSLGGEGNLDQAKGDIREQAEEFLRVFMGLEHSTWPEAWRSINYKDKDKWIKLEKENKERKDQGLPLKDMKGKEIDPRLKVHRRDGPNIPATVKKRVGISQWSRQKSTHVWNSDQSDDDLPAGPASKIPPAPQESDSERSNLTDIAVLSPRRIQSAEKEAGEDLEEDLEDDDAANGDGDIEGEENLSTQAPLENSDDAEVEQTTTKAPRKTTIKLSFGTGQGQGQKRKRAAQETSRKKPCKGGKNALSSEIVRESNNDYEDAGKAKGEPQTTQNAKAAPKKKARAA